MGLHRYLLVLVLQLLLQLWCAVRGYGTSPYVYVVNGFESHMLSLLIGVCLMKLCVIACA